MDAAKSRLRSMGECAVSGVTVAELNELVLDVGLDPHLARIVHAISPYSGSPIALLVADARVFGELVQAGVIRG